MLTTHSFQHAPPRSILERLVDLMGKTVQHSRECKNAPKDSTTLCEEMEQALPAAGHTNLKRREIIAHPNPCRRNFVARMCRIDGFHILRDTILVPRNLVRPILEVSSRYDMDIVLIVLGQRWLMARLMSAVEHPNQAWKVRAEGKVVDVVREIGTNCQLRHTGRTYQISSDALAYADVQRGRDFANVKVCLQTAAFTYLCSCPLVCLIYALRKYVIIGSVIPSMIQKSLPNLFAGITAGILIE
mmetsp:Transcript_44137/g.103161  ORF Transcript_44137/g.103161 Transcript_44137/m.103161 type:complete len:244 (-) Transcript_44137:568-1299(-)